MSSDKLPAVLAVLAADTQLWGDFLALCDCGGRQAGSASGQAALRLAHELLSAIDRSTRVEPVTYAGWRCFEASLELEDGTALACNRLLGSESTPPPGISTEVIDLGRGTPEEFERNARDIAGRFVLVRHEYPFAASHIHRRRNRSEERRVGKECRL